MTQLTRMRSQVIFALDVERQSDTVQGLFFAGNSTTAVMHILPIQTERCAKLDWSHPFVRRQRQQKIFSLAKFSKQKEMYTLMLPVDAMAQKRRRYNKVEPILRGELVVGARADLFGNIS